MHIKHEYLLKVEFQFNILADKASSFVTKYTSETSV